MAPFPSNGKFPQPPCLPSSKPVPSSTPPLLPLLLLLASLLSAPPPAGATRMGHVAASKRASATPPPCAGPHPPVCAGAVKTIFVIGAGMAGTSAAHNLTLTNPCFKVIVVEARNRVGGRMYSRAGDVPGLGEVRAEMGGQWIHNAIGNPLTALAKKYNLKIGAMNEEYAQYSDAGARYSDAGLDKAERAYQALMKKALRYAGTLDNDISVDAAFRHVNTTLYLTPFVQNRACQDFEFNYGGLDTLSATYYDDEGFGGRDVLVLDGYDNIPKFLLRDAQAGGAQLHLNATVTAVTVTKQGSVTVTVTESANAATNDQASGGAAGTKQGARRKGRGKASTVTYAADAVIVTVPLGVLKAGDIVFQPPLSTKKQGAIKRLGFGVGAKVATFFKSRFWETAGETTPDEFGIDDADVPAMRGRFPDWRSLAHPENQSALMGYALGEYTLSVAGNATRLAADALAKIKLAFPLARLPENQPLAAWVKDWLSDPFSRGIYSFSQVGVEGGGPDGFTSDFAKVAEPEGPLFFAGEHTSTFYRASVHGAYLTGQTAAKQVAQFLK